MGQMWSNTQLWSQYSTNAHVSHPELEILHVPSLVGGLEHFIFSHILGISSSQMTNIFQRVSNHQPDHVRMRKVEDLAMEVADDMFERWDFDAQVRGMRLEGFYRSNPRFFWEFWMKDQ